MPTTRLRYFFGTSFVYRWFTGDPRSGAQGQAARSSARLAGRWGAARRWAPQRPEAALAAGSLVGAEPERWAKPGYLLVLGAHLWAPVRSCRPQKQAGSRALTGAPPRVAKRPAGSRANERGCEGNWRESRRASSPPAKGIRPSRAGRRRRLCGRFPEGAGDASGPAVLSVLLCMIQYMLHTRSST